MLFFFNKGGSVVNCSFVNNTSPRGGGAITGSDYSVIMCSFINNSLGNIYSGPGGSAIWLISRESNSYIKDCIFIDNSATSNGGTIYVGAVSVINCSFVSNHAKNAGAIYCDETSKMSYFINCSFVNNSADCGGAIFGGSVVDCSFVNNHADSFGGAVYNAKIIGDYKFYNNSATTGNDTYNVTFINSDSFSNLNLLINNNTDSDIYLFKNFMFINTDSDFIEGITINRDVTIHGNGFTIDADNKAKIFKITKGNVVFKDIIFTNALSAVSFNSIGDSGSAFVNCSFVNNHADSSGGAVYLSSGGSIVNCTFINNSATSKGGAVYLSSGGSIVNCTFIDNSIYSKYGKVYGGAVYLDNGGSIVDCTFMGNVASGFAPYGGAIYLSSGGSVVNCTFEENNGGDGGAIYFDSGSVVNCSFVNNAANRGGGICLYTLNTKIINMCTFVNSTISNSTNCKYDIVNCIFDEPPIGLKYHYEMFLNMDMSNYNKTIVFKLSNMFGPMGGKIIAFNINGNEINRTTDSDGLISFNFSEGGNYSVFASFGGDEICDSSSITTNIFVNCISLSVNDLNIIKGDVGYLVANLSDIGGPLSNKNITFRIGNKRYNVTTNEQGLANFEISNYLTEFGNYVINVSFVGDDSFYPVSINVSVNVVRYLGELTIAQEGKYYGDTNLTFHLVNLKNNESIVDAPIIIILANNTPITLFTNSMGAATYEVSLPPGSYNVNASVSIPYVKVNDAELIFHVSKIMGEIKITQDEDCRLLHIKVFNITTGEVFKGFNVTLHFEPNAQFRNVKTDEYGIANFTMPFTPGNYSVEAYVDGEYMEFNTARLDNIVINNNVNSVVSFVPEILTFDYLGSGKIGLYLSGCTVKLSDISVIDHPEAIISLNNNEITVSGLDAGVYTLKVVSDPFTNYNSVTRTTNIVVNKIDSTLILNPTSFDYGKSGSVEFNVDGCQIIKDNIRILNHPEAIIALSGNKITVSNLSAGTYTLQVTSSPDDNHNAVTVNTTITVNRVDSSINLTSISFDYGQTGSSNVNVVGGSVLRSNIQVLNHPNANINIYDNIISVSGLDAGSYTLQVTTTPDDNHKAVTGTTSITVGKVDSSLNITKAIVFDYGSSDSTSIEISGCSINSNNIKILNHPEATVVFSGKVISVSGLDAGSYTLQVTTTPDNNHKSVTKTIGVTVNEIASDVIFVNQPLSFDYGGSDSTALVLTGCSVDLNNIKVIGAQANIALKNNEITVSGLDAGSYTLQVTTTPNKNYKSVTKTINVIVNKIDSTISFNETGLVFDQGDSASVKITVGGGSVGKIGVDNHPEAIITNNGNEFTISNLNYGSYMLTVVSNPDKNHNAISKSLDITVNKMLSNVTFGGDIVFDYGDSGSTWIKVIGGGVSPSDISIVGHSEADITMTSNNIIFVSNLNVGVYTLKVITTPDENHRSVEATVPVIVNKANSTVEFNDISFDYGLSGSTSVSVDGGKLLLSDISVIGQSDAKITYNGKSITVSDLDAGSYTLQVTTTPDSNHNAVNATVNVYVNKVDSVLVLSDDIVFDYGDSGSTVITAGGDDVSLSGISVVGEENAKISLNNYKITVSNLDAGRYTLRVTTSPDKNHNPITRNVDIVVNKVDSVIGLTNAVIFDYGGFGSTNVTVIGGDVKYSGISVDDYDNAKISLNGREITVSNLDAGTYILRVVTSPDKNHNSVTGTTSIIVNKIDSELSFKNNVSFDYGSSGSTGVIMSGCSVERSGVSVINHNEAVISVVGDTIAVSNLAVGNYTLRVVSTPDRNHKAVTKTVEITVAKSDSSVGFTNDISFDYGSSGTTTLILDGCSVDVKDIKVVGFDALIDINDNNMVTVSGLDVGFYNLSVTSAPDSNHKSVTRFVGVTVKKVDSNVEFDKKELSFVYGGSGSVGVNVVDGSLSKDNILVLNHPEAKIQLNGNVVTVSGLNANTYTLTVTSIGDKNHNDFTNSIDVIVTKASSVINFTNDVVVFDYGGSGSVGVNVVGGTLSEGNIRVLNHGEAEIHLKDGSIIVSGLNVGKYTLSVTSSPDSNHVAVTKTVGITVNRVDSSIDFDSNLISYAYGSSGSVGVNVVGGTISISDVIIVGSEAKPTFKDNKITVSGLDVGDYTLKVTTTPDSNHNSVSGTINVSVSKSKSKIDYTNDISFDYGGSGITTLILDGCSVDVKDIKVVGFDALIEINDNNMVTVSGLDVGFYNLSVTSAPDSNHESVTRFVGVTVKKVDSNVEFDKKELSFVYGGSGSVGVNIVGGSLSKDNILVLNHPEAKIHLNGNIVTVSGLNANTYTLTVTSIGDKNHNDFTNSIDVIVTKASSSINFTNDVVFDYGGSGSVGVNVVGGTLLEGNIRVLNHGEAEIHLKDGSIIVSGLDVGKYTLSVTSSPDSNHVAVTKTVGITVNRVDSTIDFDSNLISYAYGSSGSVGVN
ncbi:hypothetical protein, partial [Methanobrevibacter sp.]|uniref:hypothetical protein n=1 Tax=Methanobrevibacter sp. TaxID=66852 RepID=UPI002E7A8EFD